MDHPLVGLKIVEGTPSDGEVARSLLGSTFPLLQIVMPTSYWDIDPPARGTWVINVDNSNTITSVVRT